MTHENYLKIEPLIHQALELVRDASNIAFLADEYELANELHPLRLKLSNISCDLTLKRISDIAKSNPS